MSNVKEVHIPDNPVLEHSMRPCRRSPDLEREKYRWTADRVCQHDQHALSAVTVVIHEYADSDSDNVVSISSLFFIVQEVVEEDIL